jgi:hypothetical protein
MQIDVLARERARVRACAWPWRVLRKNGRRGQRPCLPCACCWSQWRGSIHQQVPETFSCNDAVVQGDRLGCGHLQVSRPHLCLLESDLRSPRSCVALPAPPSSCTAPSPLRTDCRMRSTFFAMPALQRVRSTSCRSPGVVGAAMTAPRSAQQLPSADQSNYTADRSDPTVARADTGSGGKPSCSASDGDEQAAAGESSDSRELRQTSSCAGPGRRRPLQPRQRRSTPPHGE